MHEKMFIHLICIFAPPYRGTPEKHCITGRNQALQHFSGNLKACPNSMTQTNDTWDLSVTFFDKPLLISLIAFLSP